MRTSSRYRRSYPLIDNTLAIQTVVWLLVIAFLVLLIDHPLNQFLDQSDGMIIEAARFFTRFGNSAWYLVPLGIALPVLWFVRVKLPAPQRAFVTWLFWIGLFLAVAIASSGILVNILKIVIGRGRPRMVESEGDFVFAPFTVDSDFASLPSGHANTVFVVATALVALLPARRWALWTIATCLALTRVLVGAHFLADVVVGALLGIVTTRLWLLWFCRQQPQIMADGRGWMMCDHRRRGPLSFSLFSWLRWLRNAA